MLSNRLLWPGMIGIALAVGIGVQMGESAIGAIDPIHFQGAAPPPQGIDPNVPPPPAQSTYASAYGWAEGDAARQADGGTAAQDFDYVPQPELRPAAEPIWQEPQAPVSLAPWRPGQVSAHPEIDRYTDYPTEEKPAARTASDRPALDRISADQSAPEQAEPQPDKPAPNP